MHTCQRLFVEPSPKLKMVLGCGCSATVAATGHLSQAEYCFAVQRVRGSGMSTASDSVCPLHPLQHPPWLRSDLQQISYLTDLDSFHAHVRVPKQCMQCMRISHRTTRQQLLHADCDWSLGYQLHKPSRMISHVVIYLHKPQHKPSGSCLAAECVQPSSIVAASPHHRGRRGIFPCRLSPRRTVGGWKL